MKDLLWSIMAARISILSGDHSICSQEAEWDRRCCSACFCCVVLFSRGSRLLTCYSGSIFSFQWAQPSTETPSQISPAVCLWGDSRSSQVLVLPHWRLGCQYMNLGNTFKPWKRPYFKVPYQMSPLGAGPDRTSIPHPFSKGSEIILKEGTEMLYDHRSRGLERDGVFWTWPVSILRISQRLWLPVRPVQNQFR